MNDSGRLAAPARAVFEREGWQRLVSPGTLEALRLAIAALEQTSASFIRDTLVRGVFFEIQSRSGRKGDEAVFPGALRKGQRKNNFRPRIPSAGHLRPLLGREILKILRVFLRFHLVVAAESDPHLGAILGSYSFADPKITSPSKGQPAFARLRKDPSVVAAVESCGVISPRCLVDQVNLKLPRLGTCFP